MLTTRIVHFLHFLWNKRSIFVFLVIAIVSESAMGAKILGVRAWPGKEFSRIAVEHNCKKLNVQYSHLRRS